MNEIIFRQLDIIEMEASAVVQAVRTMRLMIQSQSAVQEQAPVRDVKDCAHPETALSSERSTLAERVVVCTKCGKEILRRPQS